MNILALETSTNACSVALQNKDEVTYLHKIAPMQHTKLILPMIHELLNSASLTLDQLDAIAYGRGPGSFTGIRIASSVAQGLGFAANKPLIPLSSLTIYAQTAYLEKHYESVLVAVDARMGQIYWAQYEAASGIMKLCGEESVCAPHEVYPVALKLWQGIGDAWEVYYDQLVKALGDKPNSIQNIFPNAKAMLPLARIKFETGECVDASVAIPVYLR